MEMFKVKLLTYIMSFTGNRIYFISCPIDIDRCGYLDMDIVPEEFKHKKSQNFHCRLCKFYLGKVCFINWI